MAVAMRMIAVFLLAAAASLTWSPSSADLHSRYGEPNMERFMARPRISLMVEYGSDHLACVARLEPPQSLVVNQDLQAPLMPSEAVSEVIEEIAPAKIRGKQINVATTQSGCNVVAITDYEDLWIMRATHECEPDSPDRDASTTINFKRDICPKQKPPVSETPVQPPVIPLPE
jgi:hypothetical protein